MSRKIYIVGEKLNASGVTITRRYSSSLQKAVEHIRTKCERAEIMSELTGEETLVIKHFDEKIKDTSYAIIGKYRYEIETAYSI